MREGYEGLVRGNLDAPKRKVAFGDQNPVDAPVADDELVNNLRFGDGGLLREGEGDAVDRFGGRSLKGRYIIRVGWDDVRGWFAEVRHSSVESRQAIDNNLRVELLLELRALVPSGRMRADWRRQITSLSKA